MTDEPGHGPGSFADRESFMIDVLTHLSDLMRTSVGNEQTADLISSVAFRMAQGVKDELGDLPVSRQSARQTADVLVRLKAQIGGEFEVAHQDENGVEFRGCKCPFGDKVKGRVGLCQMTSGVFGRVAADAMGYARVTVVESIARGHDSCKVVVDLRRGGDVDEPADPSTTEYFRSPSDDP